MRKSPYFPLLAMALVLAACGRDAPSRPSAAPTVTAVEPAPWTVLTGAASITFKAAGADRVTLSVDGGERGAVDHAPFLFTLDTAGLANGLHTLGIHAESRAGGADASIVFLTDNPGRGRAIVVRPRDPRVAPGGTLQLTAYALGISDRQVAWSIASSGSASPPEATVDAAGVLHAGPGTGVCLVTARSAAAPELADSVSVSVSFPNSGGMVLNGIPPHVRLNTSYSFTVTVPTHAGSGIAWSLPLGPATGSIDGSGHYTAPSVLPDSAFVTIRAELLPGPGPFVETTVPIFPEHVVTVTPDSAVVSAGGVSQLAAATEGLADPTVTWSVTGGSAFGSVSSSGLYTAPTVLPDPPEATVRATANGDPGAYDEAVVTLVPAPGADEIRYVSDLLTGGRRLYLLSEEATGVLAYALYRVGQITGTSNPYPIGTLQWNGSDYDYLAYPTNHLVIIPPDGLDWTYTVTAADGDFAPVFNYAPEPLGAYYLGHLQFQLQMSGYLNITVDHQCAPGPFRSLYGYVFVRRIQGTTLRNFGTRMNLDLEHRGALSNVTDVEAWADTLQGTATRSSGGDLVFDETWDAGDGWGPQGESNSWNRTWNDHGTFNGSTYAIPNGITWGGGLNGVPWDCPYCQWGAAGDLSRDGSPFGTIRFEFPVVLGQTPAPPAILDYAHGQLLELQAPILGQTGPLSRPWPLPDPFGRLITSAGSPSGATSPPPR